MSASNEVVARFVGSITPLRLLPETHFAAAVPDGVYDAPMVTPSLRPPRARDTRLPFSTSIQSDAAAVEIAGSRRRLLIGCYVITTQRKAFMKHAAVQHCCCHWY